MPLSLTQSTPPTVEPVTIEEAKVQCRIDGDDEDVYIAQLIRAAREHVEMFTCRQLCTASWTWKLDTFPQVLTVPRPPLVSVTSINYVDTDGTSQLLAPAAYTVDTTSQPGRIVEAYGYDWPSTRDQIQAVTVVYVAGYGAAVAVPFSIKAAIKLLVAQWFEIREPVITGTIVTEVPMTVASLLWPYRVLSW